MPLERVPRHNGCESIHGEATMEHPEYFAASPSAQEGKAGYILMWLLGVPIPILFLIYLLRGCT